MLYEFRTLDPNRSQLGSLQLLHFPLHWQTSTTAGPHTTWAGGLTAFRAILHSSLEPPSLPFNSIVPLTLCLAMWLTSEECWSAEARRLERGLWDWARLLLPLATSMKTCLG